MLWRLQTLLGRRYFGRWQPEQLALFTDACKLSLSENSFHFLELQSCPTDYHGNVSTSRYKATAVIAASRLNSLGPGREGDSLLHLQ